MSQTFQPTLFDDLDSVTERSTKGVTVPKDFSWAESYLQLLREDPNIWYFPWLPGRHKDVYNARYLLGSRKVPPIYSNDARQAIILLKNMKFPEDVIIENLLKNPHEKYHDSPKQINFEDYGI